MVNPAYLEGGHPACSLCSLCAMCLADGPIPDFEATGIEGLFGIWPS